MSAHKASRTTMPVRPTQVDSETSQLCPQCKQWKTKKEMSSQSHYDDNGNKQHICKSCHMAYLEHSLITQACRKCKVEKHIDEFHRRGVGYHRICKECWKNYKTPKTKRAIILNQPENYPILSKRIENLNNRLRLMAYSFANGNLEADDIYGAMVDEILFKSKPEDSDARILTRAKWAAYAVVRRNLLYNAYVADESAMTVTDEDGETDIDIRVSFYESAEDEYVKMERAERIAALISQLEPKYRTIVAMISLGHSQREIAYTLKVSDQSVSTYMKKIAEELEKLGFSEV